MRCFEKEEKRKPMQYAAKYNPELYYKYRWGYKRWVVGKVIACVLPFCYLFYLYCTYSSHLNESLGIAIGETIMKIPYLFICILIAFILWDLSNTGGFFAFKRKGEICKIDKKKKSVTITYHLLFREWKEKTEDVYDVVYEKRKGRAKIIGNKTIYLYKHYSKFKEILGEIEKL